MSDAIDLCPTCGAQWMRYERTEDPGPPVAFSGEGINRYLFPQDPVIVVECAGGHEFKATSGEYDVVDEVAQPPRFVLASEGSQ